MNQQTKEAMLAQFSPEQLAAHKELCDLITAATSRKKPTKRTPKAKLTPVPKWVYDRYYALHRQWFERAHKLMLNDGHAYQPCKKLNFTKTNDITTGIENWIKWSGGQAERTGVEGRTIKTGTYTTATGEKIGGGHIRIKSSGTKGSTDVAGTFRGRSLKVEVKNKYTKDTIKQHQLEYRDKVVAAGALHLFATDMEVFINWWDNVVVKLPDLELF